MNTPNATYADPAVRGEAIADDRARALLGQVMGYVALAAARGREQLAIGLLLFGLGLLLGLEARAWGER